MKNIIHTSRRTAASWVAVALLSACGGGGGGSASVSSDPAGGSGAYSMGAISGFGSIIVNGVRHDDKSARVFDDDGAARRSDELKLGMTERAAATSSSWA